MIVGLMGYKRSHLLNLTQNTDPCVWQSGYQGVGIRDSLMYILSGFIDWPEVLSHPEFSIGFLHEQTEGTIGWLWNGLIKHWSVKFCNRFNVQKRPPDRVHTVFYWASFPLMNSGSISYSSSHLSLCPDLEIYSREVGPQLYTPHSASGQGKLDYTRRQRKRWSCILLADSVFIYQKLLKGFAGDKCLSAFCPAELVGAGSI